jgi:hypothetical protein
VFNVLFVGYSLTKNNINNTYQYNMISKNFSKTMNYLIQSESFFVRVSVLTKFIHFPDILKLTKIVEIRKKGSINYAKNYRPVFLISAEVKVFELLASTSSRSSISGLSTKILTSTLNDMIYYFYSVWVHLKQKAYFNRPNNLEDLLQRIRSKMERKALTLLSAVYKVSVSAKWLAGNNFNICVKLYC